MRNMLLTILGLILLLPAGGAAAELRLCPAPGGGCDGTDLGQALRGARSGDVVTLAPGLYRQAGVIAADGVVLKGEAGASLVGTAAEGKAALVVKGNDTVIEGIDCSGITVPSANGACVRLEGRNLTLRRVHFHDSQEGLLTATATGRVLIEDSLFEHLGEGGRAHGLYVGEGGELIIRRSRILASKGEGHEVKSRAGRTVIEDSVIASLDGIDSRLIDVCNGGVLEIRRSLLEKGPNSSNNQLIGFGLEGLHYADNRLTIENSLIILDRFRSDLVNGPVEPRFDKVRLVGGDSSRGLTWMPTRKAAGLPPYPALPAP